MVLDLTSGRLAQAIEHAENALSSVEARLAELRQSMNGELPPLPDEDDAMNNGKVDVKGKGKAKAQTKLVRDDLVQKMSKSQIEAEIKELEGLKDDLGLKVRRHSLCS
jgi:HAT1-interacting factor 1